MSSIINNSNSNSALVNTLESSNSMMNPNVYSTKEVYPTSATVWTKCASSNGGLQNSQTLNFNLNKYGIIEQILLNYSKNASTLATTFPAGDIFNVIEKVELLSGSRTISILSSQDLMAQFSNLTVSQYNVINGTAIIERGPTTSGTERAVNYDYVVPLTYGFMQDINTQLNASFLEPLSIRITWGVNTQFVVASTGGTSSGLVSCDLDVRYKSYPEQPTAQILASNYNAPELVQVSTRFYDENPQNLETALGAGAIEKVTVDLRNTDCVQDFYIMVREFKGSGATRTYEAPSQITNVTLTGSGQQIMDLKQGQMAYSTLTENGFSQSGVNNGVGTSALPSDGDPYLLGRVFKIQTGLYENGGGGALSNTLSLREINAPQIVVTFINETPIPSGSDKKNFEIAIVENCTAIYSTSSAVGRISLALSN